MASGGTVSTARTNAMRSNVIMSGYLQGATIDDERARVAAWRTRALLFAGATPGQTIEPSTNRAPGTCDFNGQLGHRAAPSMRLVVLGNYIVV